MANVSIPSKSGHYSRPELEKKVYEAMVKVSIPSKSGHYSRLF